MTECPWSRAHPAVHGVGERGRPAEVDAPARPRGAHALGLVEARVGAPVQLLGAQPVDGEGAVADRHAHAAVERSRSRSQHLLRVARRRPGQHERELVAAEAADRVHRPQRLAQQLDQPHEHGVAGGVALAVVDRLEVVEVEHGERERPARARRLGQLRLQALVEPAAVERAGERVDAREQRELVAVVLELAPLVVAQLHLPEAHARGPHEREEHERAVGERLARGHAEREEAAGHGERTRSSRCARDRTCRRTAAA